MNQFKHQDRQEGSQNVKLLPILIIPGFMSSGMEVKESDIRESWVGERIWLNLKSLGFECFGGSKKNNKNGPVNPHLQQSTGTDDSNEGQTASSSKAPSSEEERRSAILRNAWLQHGLPRRSSLGMRRDPSMSHCGPRGCGLLGTRLVYQSRQLRLWPCHPSATKRRLREGSQFGYGAV
mmetsp:Transcript_25733/g.36622  ORF Transcript_25733/g.36622 Transcript_25733/m.36622 type:complete len:179 (-) Transcript_25733:24-560(-)